MQMTYCYCWFVFFFSLCIKIKVWTWYIHQTNRFINICIYINNDVDRIRNRSIFYNEFQMIWNRFLLWFIISSGGGSNSNNKNTICVHYHYIHLLFGDVRNRDAAQRSINLCGILLTFVLLCLITLIAVNKSRDWFLSHNNQKYTEYTDIIGMHREVWKAKQHIDQINDQNITNNTSAFPQTKSLSIAHSSAYTHKKK